MDDRKHKKMPKLSETDRKKQQMHAHDMSDKFRRVRIWILLVMSRRWKEHGAHTGGYYSCNKYDVSKAKEDDTKAEQIKTELEAYMFYYHRYEAHHNAMKIADEQRLGADKKANLILDTFSVRAQDTNFLKEAAEQLINNRRVLKNSYIYGYYKTTSPEKNLFEYLQEDLEKHTNYLSEIYEKDLKLITDYQQFIKWKEEVTNYTRVTAGVWN